MLNIAVQAVRRAEKIILRSINRLESLKITLKDQNELVSEVDKLAELEIIDSINKAYPTHSIMAEESGFHDAKSEFCWIIDPLDGTTNYLHGIPHFSTSIAIKHNDNIVVGLIYDAIRNELFTAIRGEGAQLNNHRIRVSKNNKWEKAVIGSGYPSRTMKNSKSYLETFEFLVNNAAAVRHSGSTVLDLAYVAAGRLDAYWGASLQEWDLAAGVLLIREAGGFMSDFMGNHDYLDSGNIITGNPATFKLMLNMIQKTLMSPSVNL